MVAGIIIDENIGARLDVAGNDIPCGDDQLVALRKHLGMWQSAGGDNHHIRFFGDNRIRLRPAVEMEDDAELLALAHAPVDDADHFAAAFALCGQADLAARVAGGLEDHDRMATFRTDPCG